jgi:hypothetical protein
VFSLVWLYLTGDRVIGKISRSAVEAKNKRSNLVVCPCAESLISHGENLLGANNETGHMVVGFCFVTGDVYNTVISGNKFYRRRYGVETIRKFIKINFCNGEGLIN